jgi:ABC-type transport system substrate-binding protein
MALVRRLRAQELSRLTIVVAALVLLLSGCSQSGQQQPSDMAKDQTLKLIWAPTESLSVSMFALDPAHVSEDGGPQVTSLIFDGLVTLDRNGRVEPWGATSWTISPDGLTYTFSLRPNQRFSDGSSVTASDYAWSINRALNPCAGSSIYWDLTAIKDASTLIDQDCSSHPTQTANATLVGRSILPDDRANRLTILLSQPAGYFLSVLASSAGMALERRVLDQLMGYSTNPNADDVFLSLLTIKTTGQGGSGMFYLARSTLAAYNNPGTLVLKPNPHWWGIAAGKKPHYSELDFTVPLSSSDSPPSTAFDLFNADSTQAFANLLPTNLPITQFNQQPYYHEQPTLGFRALLFYWRNAPFNDINARKAFCLAINREQFNQQIDHGQVMPSWHIIPQGMVGYDIQLKGLDGAPVTGDAALAKHYWQLYLAAHHNQVPPIAINYGLQGNPDYQEVSTWLNNTWNQTLGVQTFPDLSV